MSERSADLVIVGGGPAGISTALHVHALAPKIAERMIVLEAKRYPREKICAGAIGARAFAVLERIGVEVDCPRVPIDAVALRVGGETVVARVSELGAVVRRVELDHALARVAIARGIEVRDGTPVAAIAVDGEAARVTLENGEVIRARAVVGADGVAGIVRRQIGIARNELRAQVVELDTEAVASDLPRDTLVFDFSAHDLNGYAWDFPTQVGGQPLMCRGAYVIHNLGPDSPRARIDRYLAERGLSVSRYKLKQYAERGLGPHDVISAPRVLLAGEAAGIDIATGEGIAQAIEYGALAGAYLARAFELGSFGFADWRDFVDGAHLGRQTWIRHACYRAFFSAHRRLVERLLPRMPALLEMGCRDFAGLPLGAGTMARGAGQAIAALLRAGFHAPS